jgi:hypothetical protein
MVQTYCSATHHRIRIPQAAVNFDANDSAAADIVNFSKGLILFFFHRSMIGSSDGYTLPD